MKEQIQYIGESLWPGQLAHFFIILSFVSILFSAYTYYKASSHLGQDAESNWKKLGRYGFIIHSISVFSVIGILFYLMSELRYEYYYVYEHCSDELPLRFLFSAFWEGQEGSFLLWMFWHCILGLILLRKAKEWESPVFIFLCLVEAVIASMILGIHIEIGSFSYKLGSNPSLLLRDIFDAPIFQNADYLASVKGDGLNPLLQNYWMTIHPPTLFLGFASCTIPFAYAAAGFYTRQYTEWLRPVLNWSLVATGILGIGILMGGAWAYEALTFGGYWAWDPVENMSLVPWLIMVAGVHSNLIANATGRSVKASYIYYALGFVLILYSTYLTRSGILGDSSVHSFTDMGLEVQLIFLVLFFALLSTVLYLMRRSEIPEQITEESIYSREFWMFVGSLILLFSGVIIAASTSLPVLNAIVRIFDPEFQGTVINDPIPHYNKFQLWIAVLIATLSAKTIWLRYKSNVWSKSQKVSYMIRNLIHFVLAIGMSFLLSLWIDYWHWKYTLLSITAFFTILSNGAFLIDRLKFNLKMAGSVISHAGFGIMILGIIASGLNEKVISSNPFVMQGIIDDEDLGKVIRLIKNERIFSEGYWISYVDDSIYDKTRSFKIKFEKEDSNQNILESFIVEPNVLYANDLTKVAASNPDAKHYLSKDVFISVQSLPVSQMDAELAREAEDSLTYTQHEVAIGDTIFTSKNYGIVEYVSFEPEHRDFDADNSDIALAIGVRFLSLENDSQYNAEAAISLKDNFLYQYSDQVNDLGIKLKLNEESFDRMFSLETELDYTQYLIKQGDSFEHNGIRYSLISLERNVDHMNYEALEADIAIQAVLEYEYQDSLRQLRPVYLIRDTKASSIKDYDVDAGVHARLSHIDPTKEEFSFHMANDVRDYRGFILETAEDVPRTDFIGIEAIEFPGINMFWLGSVLMLLGFFISFYFRLSLKNA